MRRAVLLAAVVVLIAGLGYGVSVVRRGFSAREEPSALEAAIARAVRHYSIPRADREEPNPWAGFDTPEVIADARAHWADHCAICHAADGSGNTDIGRNLYPRTPDMRLPATQDLSDGELYYIIRNGVRLTGMPAWGNPDLVQDDESWQLVLFIRRLPHLTEQEIHDIERMMPKTMSQIAEEEAERRFLEEGVLPATEGHGH